MRRRFTAASSMSGGSVRVRPVRLSITGAWDRPMYAWRDMPQMRCPAGGYLRKILAPDANDSRFRRHRRHAAKARQDGGLRAHQLGDDVLVGADRDRAVGVLGDPRPEPVANVGLQHLLEVLEGGAAQ